jgi:putative nucleotidyltransferase with HDIG domain
VTLMNNATAADLNTLLEVAQQAEREGRWKDALSTYELLAEDTTIAGEDRAIVLRRLGLVQFYRGELDAAGEHFVASAQIAREVNSPLQLASALNCLGNVRQSTGRLEEAEQLLEEAGRVAEGAGLRRLAIMVDQNLGTIASIRGDNTTAFARYNAALSRYEEDSDSEGAAWVMNNLGMIHTETKDWEQALACFNRALALSDERGDAEMVATVNVNLAGMHHRAQQYDVARAAADRAFAIFTRLDSKQGLGEVAKLYGMLYRDTGKLQLAESYLHVVVNICRENDFMQLQAEAEGEYALVHQAGGKSREALRSLNNAHKLFGELKAQHRLVDIERQLDRLESKYLLVTKVWGESIESKDHYTAGHCSRVAEYACKLADAAGYTGRDITWIRMGGFLHDVGKTAIDPAILSKPGKLNDAEWEAMKHHPVAGDDIVSEMNFPWDIRPMVRNHHERWDGTGYPDRLAGESIPLTARILCIADIYDALTTTRSYRPAHSPEQALDIMRREAGQTVDPQLFKLFEEKVWPTLH